MDPFHRDEEAACPHPSRWQPYFVVADADAAATTVAAFAFSVPPER